jgi:hypothetical protein
VKEHGIVMKSHIVNDFCELEPDEPWTVVDRVEPKSCLVALESQGPTWARSWIAPLKSDLVVGIERELRNREALVWDGESPTSTISNSMHGVFGAVCCCVRCQGNWWSGGTAAYELDEVDVSVMRLRMVCRRTR